MDCPICGKDVPAEGTTQEWWPVHKVHRECPYCECSWVDVYEHLGATSIETPEYTADGPTTLDIIEYNISALVRCNFCKQEVELALRDLPTTIGGKCDPRWFTCPSCNTLATVREAGERL